MAEIFAFLKLLPAIFKLCVEAKRFIDNALGDQAERILNEMADSFASLSKSKTTQERTDALKRIQDSIGKL